MFARAVVVGCVAAMLAAGCGTDAPPAGVTLEVAADAPLGGEPTRIAVFVKSESPSGDTRVLDDGPILFDLPGGAELASEPLTVAFERGAELADPLFVFVQIRSETAILATGGGLFDRASTESLRIKVAPYDASCDLDGDGFLACSGDGGGACCAHLPSDAVAGLADCEDDPEALASVYEAFSEDLPGLHCDLVQRNEAGEPISWPLQASQIHAFVPPLDERTPCWCSNGVDEDCLGGDLPCDDVDADGDGFVRDHDCDDSRETVFPNADELCDGLDNDCDGDIDEDNPLVGEPGGEPQPALCLPEGDEYDEEGECRLGTTRCAGVDGESAFLCEGYVAPAEERCDGRDNDCNGRIDEGNPGGGGACELAEADGLCAAGRLVCVEDGDGVMSCVGPEPAEEICDGLDNDCDDIVDESDENEEEPLTVACYPLGLDHPSIGRAGCVTGVYTCRDGEYDTTCAGAVVPVAETCANNGADDDCNEIQDDIAGLETDCATGDPGICSLGVWRCVDDDLVCVPTASPGVETCRPDSMAIDDDCDGVFDNVAVPDGGAVANGTASVGSIPLDPCTLDGVDEGAPSYCVEGELRCRDDLEGTMLPEGDVGLVCVPLVDHTGHAGHSDFVRGPETCANEGFDNDCDGDEDDVPNRGNPCSADAFGVCRAGTLLCVDTNVPSDGEVDTLACVPSEPTAGGETCANLDPAQTLATLGDPDEYDAAYDDDCDGLEDNVPVLLGETESTVGGLCQVAGEAESSACRTGVLTCSALCTGAHKSSVVDASADIVCCSVLEPSPVESEAACNLVDDDCDGEVDEGFTLLTDDHCGGCLNVCGSGRSCCPELSAPPVASCTDLTTDEQNCGACGTVCDPTGEAGEAGDHCEAVAGDGVCRCFDGPACAQNEVCDIDSHTCRCGEEPACEPNEACTDFGIGIGCWCGEAQCVLGEICAVDGEDIHCAWGGTECPVGSFRRDDRCVCTTDVQGDAFCQSDHPDALGEGTPIATAACVDLVCRDVQVDPQACGSVDANEVCNEGEACRDGQCSCTREGSLFRCGDNEMCVDAGGTDYQCTCGDQVADTPRANACLEPEGCNAAGKCFCWFGPACVNGTCPETFGEDCQCDDGYYGIDCSLTCPGGGGTDQCSGHGTCDDGFDGTGWCSCLDDYYGPNCSELCDCGGGGCNDGASGDGTCL